MLKYRVSPKHLAPKLIFSRRIGGGGLLKLLSIRRGANSKRGAYLKLGANSSIYGI